MNYKPLSQVKRRGVETLAALRSEDAMASVSAGKKLLAEAKSFGLGMRDYLNLAVDVRGSEEADKRYRDDRGYLSGYEASLAYLNLPIQNDFERGIVLEAASDTFQTFPGVRAIFPEVVDDVVRWKFRQDNLETTAAIVGSSRTMSGVELISTVVDDKAEDYQVVSAVAELGRFPVKTIRLSEQSVKFYKHGGGYRFSYEFDRRASIETLVPYVNRMDREKELSKVRAATHILINGDGVNPAAPVVKQADFVAAATNKKLNYEALLRWLVARAQAGIPVDTVVGNWDTYIDWLLLFAIPTSNATRTDAENLAASGFQIGGVPILRGTVNFALSSAAPAKQLVGMSRGDTLEELNEGGSQIEETERAITNQSITFTKSVNTGYKLAFSDTRSIYDYDSTDD
ncbi:hypothetical protein [Mesorhizobium sp.]|uniref:hypothetical protein n=3 Tax=Mesorhizobium sp. TaxID=1871066 RepID=UPI000FE4413D|nr:hypothetical protein [Mesorhizobium sp.]RWH52141.1 MAG: hypothetical protein EOQ82_27055 [Mesorhizobium sp.]RWI48428.1 MAG: hypothetical protein EOR15_13780 [Mesorhizobium sp.]RWI64077.1 MAG: hypothetical protein EOR18_30450 [Mesorhizobium sp.]RWI74772.1 MAG: hypothetical protein EOR19_20020 [Mesorhizobium sp.]RWI88179.1 MAG: hypothetical protein EOR20_03835 [Mesorhizobium sp.]